MRSFNKNDIKLFVDTQFVDHPSRVNLPNRNNLLNYKRNNNAQSLYNPHTNLISTTNLHSDGKITPSFSSQQYIKNILQNTKNLERIEKDKNTNANNRNQVTNTITQNKIGSSERLNVPVISGEIMNSNLKFKTLENRVNTEFKNTKIDDDLHKNYNSQHNFNRNMSTMDLNPKNWLNGTGE